MSRKGQLFFSDLTIAIFIFLVVFVFISLTWSGLLDSVESDVQTLFIKRNIIRISDQLVRGTGYPENWEDDPGQATTIGLVVDDRVIDDAKLAIFVNTNYDIIKDKLETGGNEFYFRLVGTSVSAGQEPIPAKNSLFIRRFVIYNNEIRQMEFYLWS